MILNLTQHAATADQVAAGVVNVNPEFKERLTVFLTFDTIPTLGEIEYAAELVVGLAVEHGVTKAMIGGAPFLMPTLEKALIAVGITPCYAFSKRVVIKEADGVKERIVFKHEGFVWVDV
jgi:hypothetical protein